MCVGGGGFCLEASSVCVCGGGGGKVCPGNLNCFELRLAANRPHRSFAPDTSHTVVLRWLPEALLYFFKDLVLLYERTVNPAAEVVFPHT